MLMMNFTRNITNTDLSRIVHISKHENHDCLHDMYNDNALQILTCSALHRPAALAFRGAATIRSFIVHTCTHIY